MGRLTFEGNFCDIAQCAEMHDCDYGEKKCSQRKTWERLKQYEDTGLSPEEVDTLKAENARLHNENFWLTEEKTTPDVVRCHLCKHIFFKDFSAYCRYRVGALRPDGYCERGERRNDNA